MAMVNNQYMGTTRTILLAMNSSGLIALPEVVMSMMKPLITKNMSTPVAPNSPGRNALNGDI
jgi:hypothetical protein